ncbi:hypothetical protein A1D29_05225 [Pasteurellaceae bacterium Orientalotternb1]|nr:hypothetical protein A1D29_05225 [Pasteurellaceae bacterium Orientalotternb1]
MGGWKWGSFIPGSGDIVTTHNETKEIAKDTVRAFGKTQNNQQIVMMGDTYWYFISSVHTNELQKLLNTKLPKAFSTQKNQPFGIYLDSNAKGFSTGHFSLYYQPKTAQETSTIKTLGFTPTKPDPQIYRKQYKFEGEMYKKADNIKLEYQFETALPVSIQVSKRETNVDGSLLATKVATTPLALAADIILIPAMLIMLPFMD